MSSSTLAQESLASPELVLPILCLAGLEMISPLQATFAASKSAVATVRTDVLMQFPRAAFVIHPLGSGLGGSCSRCEEQGIDVSKPSRTSHGVLVSTLETFPGAPAGNLSGCLYACSKWREEEVTTEGERFGVDVSSWSPQARRFVARAPVWLQQPLRRIWATEPGTGTDVGAARLPPLGEPRLGAALEVRGGEVFACGGWSDQEPMSASTTTEVYDPLSETWCLAPPQQLCAECRCWVVASVLVHQLYSSSDHSAEDTQQLTPLAKDAVQLPPRYVASKIVERFEAQSGVWQMLPGMCVSRAEAASATVAGVLYVCGGFSELGEPQSSTERWSLESGEWESLPPMAYARAFAAARPWGGCLLVCGGMGVDGRALRSAELFDPREGRWQPWDPPADATACAAELPTAASAGLL